MKFAYKVIKNRKNNKTSNKSATVGISSSIVSFILVAKVTLGFRECAQIVKIAKDTGCKVEIASGTKSGNSDSVLSLVSMGIVADKSLVLTIKGERNDEALKNISKVLNGTVEK